MDQITPWLLYAVVIVGFYLLILAPQRKQRKQMAEMLAALTPGDEVVTAGGIYGTLRSLEDDAVIIEIADGVSIKVAKSAIVARTGGGEGEE